MATVLIDTVPAELRALPTPCVVLDKGRMRRNVDAMHAAVARLGPGAPLRVHVKTLKAPAATRWAAGLPPFGTDVVAGPAGRITASTVAEIDAFAAAGFRDVTYAVGVEPGKAAALARVVRKYAADATPLVVRLITDNLAGAEATAAAIAALPGDGSGAPLSFPTLIEVDVGQHRGGIARDEAIVALGAFLHRGCAARFADRPAPPLTLGGVLAHSGHAYAHTAVADVAARAEEETERLVAAANALRAAGLPCDTVSAGSTPCCAHRPVKGAEGLTECRAGVFVTHDLDQSRIGSCEHGDDDIAITVLAAVIGHNTGDATAGVPPAIVIDAGGLALSKDVSAQAKEAGLGYGLVLGEPALCVASVSQEHGLLRPRPFGVDADVAAVMAAAFARYPVGARVRIVPHHACFTAAAHAVLHAWDPAAGTVEAWPSVVGWY